MAPSRFNRSITRAAAYLPGLRRLPLLRLLALADVALLAREHVSRLEPHERRRVMELVRLGRGRKRNLTQREREELARLVAKAEPRAFAGAAAARLSPVPLARSGRRSGGPRS